MHDLEHPQDMQMFVELDWMAESLEFVGCL